METFLKERRGYYYGLDDHDYNGEKEEEEEDGEAVMVYNAEGPFETTPEVYGKQQFHSAGEWDSDSPTSEIVKKRLNESGQLNRQKLLQEEASPYGLPTFYSNADKETNNAVPPNARPIVEVAKEFLSDRLSDKTSNLKDEKKTRKFKSLRALLQGDKDGLQADAEATYEAVTTAWYQPDAKENALNKTKPILHPELFDNNSRAFLHTVESETDNQTEEEGSSNFGVQHDETDTDLTTVSPGDTAFRELFHLLEDEGKDIQGKLQKSVDQPKDLYLETVLGLVCLFVLLLLCFLAYILLKTRVRSKFHLLDDQSNAETQQITSAFLSRSSAASAIPVQSHQTCQELQHANDIVPPAVVRSLRNIRKEVIVDIGGRTVVR